MKVIFVDIDGVLVTRKSYENLKRKSMVIPFDKNAVKNLNKLTDKTGAKIVVSSSWRNGRTIPSLKKLFKSEGVTGEVIDKTGHSSDGRGKEIFEWVVLHKFLGKDYLENYVVLDDDIFDMGDYGHNIVHIEDGMRGKGFEKKHLEQALEFLNNEVW